MADGKTEEVPLWKQLEQLIADIQKQLAPGAKITHNAKVKGHKSGIDRQIDVLVEQSIGQFNMTIAIDCKDHGNPLDVKRRGRRRDDGQRHPSEPRVHRLP